tara:strand:+ start:7783 stop:7917 length:135 start_codon:yes stop_codon:yes gene_type:complete
VKPEIAEDVKTILEDSIKQAGDYYNLAIEQIGEGAIGSSWYAVH